MGERPILCPWCDEPMPAATPSGYCSRECKYYANNADEFYDGPESVSLYDDDCDDEVDRG